MIRRSGFTMIELMVVLAILGIMAASAVPLYHTYQQRAYGSEAALMLKQILDAEIMYFLEYDTFFPGVGQTIFISHNDLPSDQDITDVKEALKITIPVGHFLDFTITHGIEADGTKFCIVDIRADFDLFKADEIHPDPTYISAKMDGKGTVTPL